MTGRYDWAYKKARKAMLTQAAAAGLPCALCSRPINYELPGTHKWGPTADHVIPLKYGGDERTLQPAHKHCQSKQGNRLSRAPKASMPSGPITPAQANSLHTPDVDGIEGGLPRFQSPPAPNATDSLWDVLGPWVKAEGIRLRPWQELVARRAFEVDGDGRLVWRTVVGSTPRQAGKSWLVKAVALARASHPEVFGEPQAIVHVANKHLSARRIHSQAWGWAREKGLEVRTAQGMERIIWPDGSSWDALTLASVYGSSSGCAILDEIWDVSPEDYREGIRPTQVERSMPQLWALSTAHRRATGLMADLMAQGRAGQGRVLLMDWGAPVGVDPEDPGMWESWSPFWSEQRAEEMSLMVGTDGFVEQWANVWPDQSDEIRWLPKRLTDAAQADELQVPRDSWVGVETPWNDPPAVGRWACVFVWGLPNGDVQAKVQRVDTVDDVVCAVGARRVMCHESVVGQLAAAGKRSRVEGVNTSKGRASTEVLGQLLKGGRLQVDAIEDGVWRAVHVTPADGGVMVDGKRSAGDVSAVKALSWGAWQVEVARHSGFTLVAGA